VRLYYIVDVYLVVLLGEVAGLEYLANRKTAVLAEIVQLD